MRPLVWLRDDIHHLDTPLSIDLPGEAIGGRPLVRRPRRSFLWEGVFIIFALEAERLVAPCQLEEAEDLFKGFAIDPIAFALVARGGADVNLLRHLVQPPRLISAREADESAALGKLIEPGDFEREAQRIPSGQHISDRTDLDALGIMNHMLREDRQTAHRDAFTGSVMFWEAHWV